MTPEQVAALAANATPGPFEEKDGQIWATWPDMDDGWRFRHCLADLRTHSGWPRFNKFEGCYGNGKFFAAAPDMADLIARMDEVIKAADDMANGPTAEDEDALAAVAAYLAAREKLK